MKILMVNSVDIAGKAASGAEKFMRDLLQHMGPPYEIKTCFPADSGSSIHPDFPLYKIHNKFLRKLFFDYINPVALFQFWKTLNTYRPDVVHFNSFYGISSSLAYLSTRLGYKTVVTAHDYWSFCYWSTMSRKNGPCSYCAGGKIKTPDDVMHFFHTKINHFFLKDCVFAAPSTFMKSRLSEHNFAAVHIPNGIEATSETTARKKQIVWVGRLVEEKGLQIVLPYIDGFLKKHTDWKFFVLGDGPLKNDLKKQYRNAEFLGYQDPKPYYKQVSVFVNSSLCLENLSYSIVESMNFGVIPVVADGGGNKDMVQDGKSGYLYPIGRPEQIRDILEKITSSNQDYLGTQAQMTVKTQFTLEKCISAYKDLFSLKSSLN